MAQITIEMVDEVMKRMPFVSYKEAKDALLKVDGDVLDAIILIEGGEELSEKKFDKIERKFSEETDKIKDQLSNLLKEATVIRVKVSKEGKNILNLPLTVGVVGVAAMPLVTLFGLSGAVLAKYSIIIMDNNTKEEVDLGTLDAEKREILKEMLLTSFSNIKDTVLRKDKEKPKSDDDSEDVDLEEDLFDDDENK